MRTGFLTGLISRALNRLETNFTQRTRVYRVNRPVYCFRSMSTPCEERGGVEREEDPQREKVGGDGEGEENQEGKKLSRRAYRRMMKAKKRAAAKDGAAAPRKRKKDENRIVNFTEENLKDTEYYFEKGLRKVYPYYFTFTSYAKGRWIGRQILEVFATEFKAYHITTYEKAIHAGRVTVNGDKVSTDYVFKDNDYIENVIHRHELPVTGAPVKIVEETEELVVVDKPSSIPIHPCGRYRHNSLTYIMAKDHGLRNLRTIYRLDRLTSGVFIFCKTDAKTRAMQQDIKQRRVSKTYLARVDGEFPSEPLECSQPIDTLSHKIGLFKVGPGGKESKTSFQRLSYNGKTSVVMCKPHTGRTHQIRVHLQFLGHPIVNDPLYNTPVWGPQRGKGGDYGKPEQQLVEELIAHHSSERFGDDVLIEQTSVSSSTSCSISAGNDKTDVRCLDEQVTEENTSCKSAEMSSSVGSRQQSNASKDAGVSGHGASISSSAGIQLCSASEDTGMSGHGASAEHGSEGQSMATRVDRLSEESNTDKAADTTSPDRPGEAHGPSGMDEVRTHTDPLCEECRRAYIDPSPDQLVMFLHALSYEGPGWRYTTDTPNWASEDWQS